MEPRGIAIIQGFGNRELIDVDIKGFRIDEKKEFAKRFFNDERIKDILARLPIVKSVNGGYHVCYRCDNVEGNLHLARLVEGSKIETFIETRGIGGYAAAPPTPGYEVRGDLLNPPKITPEERALLFAVARGFNEWEGTEKQHRELLDNWIDPEPNRPGSIFNRMGKWKEILEKHKWECLGDSESDYCRWRRPDKDKGISAISSENCFFNFSTNALPIEDWQGYSKFALYTLLNYEGDYSEAARALKDKGYIDDAIPVDAYMTIEEFEQMPEEKQNPQTINKIEAYKNDQWFSYLWKDNHSRISNADRIRRMKSICDIRKLMPSEGFIPEFVKTFLPTSDTQAIVILASALGVCSTVLNRKVNTMQGTSQLYCNLWLATVAGSSKERKSTSLNFARKLLGSTIYRDTLLSDNFTMESIFMQMGCILDSTDQISTTVKECGFMQDTQGHDYIGGVGLFFAHELGAFLSSLNKTYNQGGKEILTNLYDGTDYYTKTTRTQGCYFVYDPCLSMLAASTPEWIASNLSENDIRGGFLPRWLFFSGRGKDYILPFQDTVNDNQYCLLQDAFNTLKDKQYDNLQLCPEAFDYLWNSSKTLKRPLTTISGHGFLE